MSYIKEYSNQCTWLHERQVCRPHTHTHIYVFLLMFLQNEGGEKETAEKERKSALASSSCMLWTLQMKMPRQEVVWTLKKHRWHLEFDENSRNAEHALLGQLWDEGWDIDCVRTTRVTLKKWEAWSISSALTAKQLTVQLPQTSCHQAAALFFIFGQLQEKDTSLQLSSSFFFPFPWKKMIKTSKNRRRRRRRKGESGWRMRKERIDSRLVIDFENAARAMYRVCIPNCYNLFNQYQLPLSLNFLKGGGDLSGILRLRNPDETE